MELSLFWESSAQKSRFRRRLMNWFSKNRRIFPWRETSDPYAVWVSEIMLQQTTTETVLGYYRRFLSRFPDAVSLAQAPESEVLAYWQGLGYYRRAVQMHRCAEQVLQKFGGQFPDSLELLQSLPGIGRYTAGAVRSFAFNRPAPILEANTARLYARLMALEADLSAAAVRSRLWNFAEKIVPQQEPGAFNSALIDLGHRVCGPENPKCGECPVFEFCAAHRLGLTQKIPVRKAKEEKIYKREAALLIPYPDKDGLKKKEKGKYLFVRYPEKIRWAGLWDFPRFEMTQDTDPEKDAGLLKTVRHFFGDSARLGESLTVIRHAVTRYKIDLFFCPMIWNFENKSQKNKVFADILRRLQKEPIDFAGGIAEAGTTPFDWETLESVQGRAFNSTARRLLKTAEKWDCGELKVEKDKKPRLQEGRKTAIIKKPSRNKGEMTKKFPDLE